MKQEALDQAVRISQLLNRNLDWDGPTNYAMYRQLGRIWEMIACLN